MNDDVHIIPFIKQDEVGDGQLFMMLDYLLPVVSFVFWAWMMSQTELIVIWGPGAAYEVYIKHNAPGVYNQEAHCW